MPTCKPVLCKNMKYPVLFLAVMTFRGYLNRNAGEKNRCIVDFKFSYCNILLFPTKQKFDLLDLNSKKTLGLCSCLRAKVRNNNWSHAIFSAQMKIRAGWMHLKQLVASSKTLIIHRLRKYLYVKYWLLDESLNRASSFLVSNLTLTKLMMIIT